MSGKILYSRFLVTCQRALSPRIAAKAFTGRGSKAVEVIENLRSFTFVALGNNVN